MSDTLEVKIHLAESAGGCVHAVDLALVLRTLERAIQTATPAVAVPRLAIVRIDEDGRAFRLTLDRPLLNDPAPEHPLLDLVNAQAAGPDGLCLGTLLPRRIDALELVCGNVRALARNNMSYDIWGTEVEVAQEADGEPWPRPQPYTPLPADRRLDFDVEQFNREVAEARVDEKHWWE